MSESECYKKIKPSDLPDRIRKQVDDILFFGIEQAYKAGQIHKSKHGTLQRMVKETLIEAGQFWLWVTNDMTKLYVVYRSNKDVRLALYKE